MQYSSMMSVGRYELVISNEAASSMEQNSTELHVKQYENIIMKMFYE